MYANVVDVQGSVTTTAPSTAQIIQFPVHNYRFRYLIIELFVLLLLIGLLSRQRIACPRLAYGLALFVFLSAGVMISACGGGSTGTSRNRGTPAGTYTLVVSGTLNSGSTKVTRNVNLTLVVQ